jgi:hypothetical protein
MSNVTKITKISKTIFNSLAFILIAATTSSAFSASITYNFDFTTGTTRVAGNLTTNGTLGLLTSSDIQATNFSIFDANQEYKFVGVTKPNCSLFCSPAIVYGNALTATATEIKFSVPANYEAESVVIGGKGANGTSGQWKLNNNGINFPAFGRIEIFQTGAPQVLFVSYNLPQGYTFGTVQTAQVPVPSSLVLIAIGFCAFFRKSLRQTPQHTLN